VHTVKQLSPDLPSALLTQRMSPPPPVMPPSPPPRYASPHTQRQSHILSTRPITSSTVFTCLQLLCVKPANASIAIRDLSNDTSVTVSGRFSTFEATLATPVPEPSTWSLLCLGVAGLLARRRFAQRRG